MTDSERQKAGVVVHRHSEASNRSAGGDQVLLVSARRHPGSWVFPVGTVDPEETLQQAAARECHEESGYRVQLDSPLATVESPDASFTFFLATVIGTSEQWEKDRERRWVPVAQLVDVVPVLFRPVAQAAVQRLGA